ncbi:MAG: SpvB/TcaC N-terminal domain-containing protein, partial [Candidatus Saccharibacteria bacterium]|nr:SpvB/TcaC N-terminal domain-containing protein [Candidatus Saccharibacteria bacterium]
MAAYTDGSITGNTFAGRSFVHRNNSSSSAAISSSISSSSSSRLSSVLSSSASSVTSLFNFNAQAPAAFNYPLTNANIPSLGTSQLVATTQGNLNVSNGAAGYSIPIELPPAVRDLKPNLSLNYNSRSGNGLMGVGWNLGGLSAITRCRSSFATEGVEAQKPNPRYTISDRLCLDGQKLVVASSTSAANDSTYWAAGTEYKTELDNFAKIVAYGSSANGGH